MVTIGPWDEDDDAVRVSVQRKESRVRRIREKEVEDGPLREVTVQKWTMSRASLFMTWLFGGNIAGRERTKGIDIQGES